MGNETLKLRISAPDHPRTHFSSKYSSPGCPLSNEWCHVDVVRAVTLNVLNEEYSCDKRKDSVWITQCTCFTIDLLFTNSIQKNTTSTRSKILLVTSPPTGPVCTGCCASWSPHSHLW